MSSTKKKLIRSCSIWRALELFGDKPTLLILESYWLGDRRFGDFLKRSGLLKTVVSNRLQKLVSDGCFEKVEYQDSPKRFEYHGTEKLRAIYPIALSMLFWERKWNRRKNKLNIELMHESCGQVTEPTPVCSHCRQTIDPRQVDWLEGPGLGQMEAEYSRRRKSRGDNSLRAETQLFDTAAEIIGDRWSMLIVRALFTGQSGFNEIQADSQMATNILSERLEFLLAQKVIKKCSDKGALRERYQLATRGLDLYPVILTLMEWGDHWCGDNNGPPVLLTHLPCGQPLKLVLACSHCKEEVNETGISFTMN